MDATHTTHSYWQRAYGPYTPEAPLAGDIAVDVVIVGGGYTGLSTGWHLKQANPGMTVALLEADVVGFGASGRNGGILSESFGLHGITDKRFGPLRMKEGMQYVHRGAEYVRELIATHKMDSDFEVRGDLGVSFTNIKPAVLEKFLRDVDELGQSHRLRVRDRASLQEEFTTPMFQMAIEIIDGARLNPVKHVREMKRLALASGVAIYETTPADHIAVDTAVTIQTRAGKVTADKCVLATNAYTHLLQGVTGVQRKQIPSWTYQIVTEPLTPAQWEAIGWKKRQTINTMRTNLHYARMTPEARIVWGGGDIGLAYGRNMDRDRNEKVWAKMYRHLTSIFTPLKDIRIEDRWGGPVSLASEMAPVIGVQQNGRILYSCACSGHGIALGHLNGKTLAELALGVRSELTDVWFVNRKALSWPPSWATYPACQLARVTFNALDAFNERGAWTRRAPTA